MLNVTHGSPARRRFHLAMWIGLAMLALAGCSGPGALRTHFAEYSQAQAQAGDQQALFNLARIRNGHPPYFLQLGPFTASYSFTMGSTGSFSRLMNPLPGVTRGSAGVLGLTGSATEAPIFNFSPLSGPTFAASLITPIAPNGLSNLLSQGFPATVLLRMFADEVSLTTASGQNIFLINGLNSEDADNYGDFLRLVEVLQALQIPRALHIETVTASGATTLRLTTNARSAPVLQRLAAREGARVQLKSLAEQTLTSGFSADIKLRSYVGALYAMAADSTIADSLPVALRESLPENQRDAILRIDATADLTEPQAASVDYAGHKYVISDRTGSMRYRISFQALRFVFAECELNPSQVPQSTTLQVR
jgi:hypothetical protein